MSSKIKSITVDLDDVSEEYAEHLVNAINLFDGVIGCSKNTANIDDYLNRKAIKEEIKLKILNLWKEL